MTDTDTNILLIALCFGVACSVAACVGYALWLHITAADAEQCDETCPWDPEEADASDPTDWPNVKLEAHARYWAGLPVVRLEPIPVPEGHPEHPDTEEDVA